MTTRDRTYVEAIRDGVRARMLAAYIESRKLKQRARMAAANEPGTRLYLMGRADSYRDVAMSLYHLLWPGRLWR